MKTHMGLFTVAVDDGEGFSGYIGEGDQVYADGCVQEVPPATFSWAEAYDLKAKLTDWNQVHIAPAKGY